VTDRLASSLPVETLQAIDELILEGRTIHALLLIREKAGCSLFEAQDLHWERRMTLKELHPVLRERDEEEARQSTPEAWRAKALRGLDQLESAPLVLEALWDGDTTSWILVLSAILPGASPAHPRFTEVHLVSMRGSGEPVIAVAQEIGRMAHARWNIPLYFPALEPPDIDPPRWWDTVLSSGGAP
jgi:hypothetical protein